MEDVVLPLGNGVGHAVDGDQNDLSNGKNDSGVSFGGAECGSRAPGATEFVGNEKVKTFVEEVSSNFIIYYSYIILERTSGIPKSNPSME